MTRFAGDARRAAIREPRKGIVGHGSGELELGRQLNEQDRQLVAQHFRLREEQIELLSAIDQLQLVSDLLRQLHREAEIGRYAVAPALPGRRAVRPMKGAVDLGYSEPRGVTLERGPDSRK